MTVAKPSIERTWLDRVSAVHEPLAALWQSRRGGRTMPARRDFDTVELRPWIGGLHLVEVLPGGDYRWRVYAGKVGEVYGREWTGKKFSEVPHRNRSLLFGWFDDCLAARCPMEHTSRYDNEGRHIHWTRLFLPLADDGEVVDRVFVHSHKLN